MQIFSMEIKIYSLTFIVLFRKFYNIYQRLLAFRSHKQCINIFYKWTVTMGYKYFS